MTNGQRVYYFDNNATTRLLPEVLEAMLPFLTEYWGNPSSAYEFGRQLALYVDEARERVAALIHAEPREIVFTSCGTESNNSALHSALMLQPDKHHVVTTAVEHSANLRYAEYLARRAYQVTFLPVESDGTLDLHLLERSIRPDTGAVSVMWANNETGVLFPIEEIAAICRGRGVLFHTDAVQAAGKIHLDVKASGVDLMSLSGHKIHGPKGIGALYVRRPGKFQAYIMGGQQERGRRAGTENVAFMVAFGKAAELAQTGLQSHAPRIRALRDKLEHGILDTIPNTVRNGASEPRLGNTTNLAFQGVEAEAILIQLDQIGVCASSGSACTSGSLEPSHVLKAMGVSATRARSSIRFSLGQDNTEADVDYLLGRLPDVIGKLRGLAAHD